MRNDSRFYNERKIKITMNNSDTKQNKYLSKLLEIRGITDRLLVSFREKKERNSATEISISKGSWWEITYRKTDKTETIVNKGANWEIGAIPSIQDDGNSLHSKIAILKELLNGDKRIPNKILNKMQNHLDKIDELWKPFLGQSFPERKEFMAAHKESQNSINELIYLVFMFIMDE